MRKKPSHEWEFITYTTKKSVAWRSAEALRQDELRLGHAKAQAIVVLREDYDAGRMKPLKPPKGFDLALPVGTELCLDTPPPPEPVTEPEPEQPAKSEEDVRAGLRRLLAAEEPEVTEPAPEPEPPPKPRPPRRSKGLDL